MNPWTLFCQQLLGVKPPRAPTAPNNSLYRKRKCVICENEFFWQHNPKTITCESPACRKERKRRADLAKSQRRSEARRKAREAKQLKGT